ncbi:MAG TPA: hypothetical protein VG321_02755 [Solirubrobacteraceae bacterium]|jgi:hypothetical protein|nr:hypothetical protein [Solirubrobacteraceae bacterium]
MPKWLLPWLPAAVLVILVVIGALIGSLGAGASTAGTVILAVAVAAGLINLRLRSLKRHPPNPELVHKPFWRF